MGMELEPLIHRLPGPQASLPASLYKEGDSPAPWSSATLGGKEAKPVPTPGPEAQVNCRAGQMQTDGGLTFPLTYASTNMSCTAKPGLLGMLFFLINK